MPKTEFVQMELSGSKDEIVGFVEGMRLATATEQVWYYHDGDVEHDSLLDSIREKIGLETHVVMSRFLADTVVDYISESQALTCSVAWVKEIARVELQFSYRCFSEEVGKQVRRVIEDHLPEDVALEDYVVTKEVDDESEGVELYSPSHAYILSGEGQYVGSVPSVFRLVKRLTDQDFIDPGKVKLVYRE